MDFSQVFLSLREFFLDRQFLNLLGTTIALFCISFISWWIYSEQLSKKDLFEIPKIHADKKLKTMANKILYFLKYLVIFPLYAFMWFLIFSFFLFLLSSKRGIEEVMYFAIVIVAATRISAYVSDKLAEDMAKLLPWSLILIFLLEPNAITFKSVMSSSGEFFSHIPKVAKYLLFIMVVEWGLRLARWAMHPKEVKAGIEEAK